MTAPRSTAHKPSAAATHAETLSLDEAAARMGFDELHTDGPAPVGSKG